MLDPNALPLEQLARHVASSDLVRRLFALARDEDLGSAGDVTAFAINAPATGTASARLVAREPGIVAGAHLIDPLIHAFEFDIRVFPGQSDGTRAPAGSTICRLLGPASQLLAIERTLLNLLSRMSGVATRTAQYVEAMGTGCRARLFDTRKTTPGLRLPEKYAVRCGGGSCHRLGLHDAVLIKDNHIADVPLARLAPFIADAARRIADRRSSLLFFEVEVDSIAQLERVLEVQSGLVDVVLLDNMDPATLGRAVQLRDRANPRVELEASGGVRLDTVRDIAASGVDRVSAGDLTHHAVWLDLALDFEPLSGGG